MKSLKVIRITVAIVLALPTIFIPLAAQAQSSHFRRYKLVDMGTFGGPMSFINGVFNSVPALNSRGATVGASATPASITATSGGICGGPDGLVPNIFHAFEWRKGMVTDLGALPPSAENCSDAGSVNANGEIAGSSENGVVDPLFPINEGRAVIWKNGHIINLKTFGGNHSSANGINNRGQVVGSAQNAIPDPFSLLYFVIGGVSNGTQTRAFVWQDGTMTDLGTLGGPDAVAIFINERGQVAGYSYTNSTQNPTTGIPTVHPFIWDNGRMTDLGTLGGTIAGLGSSNMINGLNNRGELIGASTLIGDPGCLAANGCLTDLFLWNGVKMIDMTTSATGGTPLLAFAINDPGEIVGAAAFGNEPFDAFIWRNGSVTDLGHLDDCFSLAFAINSHHQVVGGTFSCADFTHHRGFLWEHDTMVDLNDLIPPGSPLEIAEAETINERGEIAGNALPVGVAGADLGTLGHAFLLIPVCDDGADGCADARLDPAIIAKSRSRSRAATTTMTTEEIERSIKKMTTTQITGFQPRVQK